jgi:hypothetical protein
MTSRRLSPIRGLNYLWYDWDVCIKGSGLSPPIGLFIVGRQQMFEEEKNHFYEKYILLTQKVDARYKEARINWSDNLKEIQFLFRVDNEHYIIRYICNNINKDNFYEHEKNINDIFRVCISPTKLTPQIFPIYCSECEKCFFSNTVRKSSKCMDCRKIEIDKVISEGECDGKTSFVYLIYSAERHKLKIGYSSNPQSRLKELETGHGSKLTTLGLIPGGAKLEKKIQKMFFDYWVAGEWFEDVEIIRNYFIEYKE